MNRDIGKPYISGFYIRETDDSLLLIYFRSFRWFWDYHIALYITLLLGSVVGVLSGEPVKLSNLIGSFMIPIFYIAGRYTDNYMVRDIISMKIQMIGDNILLLNHLSSSGSKKESYEQFDLQTARLELVFSPAIDLIYSKFELHLIQENVSKKLVEEPVLIWSKPKLPELLQLSRKKFGFNRYKVSNYLEKVINRSTYRFK